MVPIGFGVADALAAPEPDGLATTLALAEALGLGDGLGVAAATFGAGGMSPDRTAPTTIAATIAPSVAAMDVSDARSVGNIPSAPARRGASVVIGAPQLRQTCAQDGLAWPQLKHSTVSPLIGREPSTQAAAGGENADGQWATPQRAVRGRW
jgi:hypothetical protein